MADYMDLDPRQRALIALGLMDPPADPAPVQAPVVGRDGKIIPVRGNPVNPPLGPNNLPQPDGPKPRPAYDPKASPAPLSGPLKVGTGMDYGETRAESVGQALPQVPGLPPEPFDPGLADSDPRALTAHPGLQPRVPAESPYALGTYVPEGREGERFAPIPEARESIPAPAPARGRPVDPLTAARQEEEAAIMGAGEAHIMAGQAKIAAERQVIQAQAQAMEQHQASKLQADMNYQASRELARQNAAVETMKWMQSMEDMAKREPNHQRYWQNTDGFGKGLWLLGMAFSGAAQIGRQDAGLRPNPVLEMLQSEISKDVESQKERMARERDVLKTKGDLMLRTQDQSMADLKDDYSLTWARLDALEKAAVLKASAPGTMAEQAAWQQGIAWIQEAKAGIAGRKVHELSAAREAAIARAHSSDEKRKDRNLQLQLAQIEASAKIAAEQAKAAGTGKAMAGPYERKDLRAVDMKGTGISVVDEASGRPINLLVHKDQHDNFTKATQHFNTMYDALKQMRDIMSSGAEWDVILRDNPQLESLITQLGYQATDQLAPGDRKTDQDVRYGMKYMFGQNYDTTTGRIAGRIVTSPEDVVKFLDRQLATYPKKAQETLSHYLDPDIYDGAKVRMQFSPVNLAPTEKYEPTLEDEAKQAGVPAAKPQTIGSIYGLEQAETLEKVAPGSLPKMKTGNATEVSKLKTQAARMSPERIDQFANAAYEKVRGDDRAQAEILRIQRDAREKAVEAQSETTANHVWKHREALIAYVKIKHGIQLNADEGDRWLQLSRALQAAEGRK